MRLAKPHLDIGLFTPDIAAHSKFWGETVGLRLDHQLPFDEKWVQHRYDAHNSVVKVNYYQHEMPVRPPCGYVGLTIARAGHPAWEGQHPGGQRVRLVPPGTDGVVGIGIHVRTPEPQRMMDFYLHTMEFEEAAPNVARCGDTLLFVEKGPGGERSDAFTGPNFRYLTIQIFDCDAECAAIVRRGGTLGAPPVNFGSVARYGFILDPDGNWFEISARASLTGVMPGTSNK